MISAAFPQQKKLNLVSPSHKTETFRVRTIPEAEELAKKIAENCPTKMYFGIHELLINAIEHGNLAITSQEKNHHLIENTYLTEIERRLDDPQYCQKFVQILVETDPEKTTIIITDQGNGFDSKKYLNSDYQNLAQISARGIALSQELSFDEIIYNEKGNQVKITAYH